MSTSEPLEIFSMDFLHLGKSSGGYQYLLVVTDLIENIIFRKYYMTIIARYITLLAIHHTTYYLFVNQKLPINLIVISWAADHDQITHSPYINK